MITVGLDVGGANLKVARARDGDIVAVSEIACPLWLGLDRLDAALNEANPITANADQIAVTMTGELTEIFDSRADGTRQLIAHMAKRFGPETRIFAGLKGLVSVTQATAMHSDVASANFLATALLIAKRQANTVLIDMGSTTTDIVVCDRPFGLSDAERLQTGELVYTGLTRTPVPTVTTSAPLAGQWQTLARDTFATMADVRRVLENLADGVDQHATCDGRGKSRIDSLRRFARGFGRDIDELADPEKAPRATFWPVWMAAAAYVREQQLRSITDGVSHVVSRPGSAIESVVTAGIGAEEAAEVARRFNLPSIAFANFIQTPSELAANVTAAAPAVALALMAHDQRA